MDNDYIPQDVARCDLCKTSIVQCYCDFCHVNLCKPCIGEHISDDYDKHKIVPFQQRKSTLIYPKCETHENEVCKYQCKDCNIFVCSHCTASKEHNIEHEFLKLDVIFNAKKEHIQRDTIELEKHILPAYVEITTELEKQIASLDVDYKKLTSELSKRREELHRDIDNAVNQMEKDIGDVKVKHHSILKKHLDEIKQLLSLMQQTLLALHEMGDSNKVSSTIDYRSKNEMFTKLPIINVLMPKFIPKQMKKEELSGLIGKLIPLSTTLEERVCTGNKPNTFVRELLIEPEVLSIIKTGHLSLRNAACLNEEQIWTSGGTADIKGFNIQGVLQKTIKTKSGEMPNDIAVYKDGSLLYTDSSTRTVYKVKNDRPEEIFTLQGWRPANLCVTSSGDLLITMCSHDKTQYKVVRTRYSGFTLKQTIQFDDEGQPLYSGNTKIKYICENRNLDICVADCGAGAVVVVNQAGKLCFRYTGQPSPTKNKPFEPRGIATDSQSRILTTHKNNHCIYILDAHGQFLRYIDNCDLKRPYGLCVDCNDSLFVCDFYEGNVKQIRYSK